MGKRDKAFEWLNKAFDERSHWLVWLRLDPRWDVLRSDPSSFARLRQADNEMKLANGEK